MRARDAGRTLLHSGLTKIRTRRRAADSTDSKIVRQGEPTLYCFLLIHYMETGVPGAPHPAVYSYNGKGYLKRFGFIEADVFR